MTGIIFTSSVKGEENPISATPLSTVSIFQLPKDIGPTLSNPDIPQPTVSGNTDDNTPSHTIPVPFPEADIFFEKVCDPTTISLDEEITCAITITNNSPDNFSYKLLDLTSHRLSIREDSVAGGQLHKYNIIFQRGVLAGGTLPSISIDENDTPLVYNSLRELGIPPFADVQDEAIINLSTLEPFVYNGEEYTVVGMTSNGYLTAGLGSDEDIAYIPQLFPDPTIPNDVIAPFWTDLNPAAGGFLYAALLTKDNESWVVLEWEDVPAFDSDKPSPNCLENCPELYTFQVWIKTNTPEQDITFIYAKVAGSGAISGLNIGAENKDGLIGANYETVPTIENKLSVISTPGTAGESHVISYIAEPVCTGYWYSCALIKVFEVRGITFDCAYGTIIDDD